MNFSMVSTTSQPQDEHKQIRVAQTNIVHHTLQTKSSNPNTSLKPIKHEYVKQQFNTNKHEWQAEAENE